MFLLSFGYVLEWVKSFLALSQSIWNLIFQCHTVTNGRNLRKSPQYSGNDDDEDSWQKPVLVSGSAVQLKVQRISIIKVCYLSPEQAAILCAVQYMNNVQSKSIVFIFFAYSTTQHYWLFFLTVEILLLEKWGNPITEKLSGVINVGSTGVFFCRT